MYITASTKFQDEPTTPEVGIDTVGDFPMSQSFMNLSFEEQEAKKEEWRKELAEVTNCTVCNFRFTPFTFCFFFFTGGI